MRFRKVMCSCGDAFYAEMFTWRFLSGGVYTELFDGKF